MKSYPRLVSNSSPEPNVDQFVDGDSEQALIYYILREPNQAKEILERAPATLFFGTMTKTAMRAVAKRVTAGLPITGDAVKEAMAELGVREEEAKKFLLRLQSGPAVGITIGAVLDCANRLRELSSRRERFSFFERARSVVLLDREYRDELQRELEREQKSAPDDAASFAEALPVFMERVGKLDEPGYLIDGLIPDDALILFHGQPRDGKTLAVLEGAISIATGTTAFGLERLRAPEACPVLYMSEEDPERRIYDRIKWLLKGRGIDKIPNTFHISVRKQVTFDDEEWVASVVETVKRLGIRFLIPDPFRAFTECVDQGPSQLRPFALTLRKIMTETGCAIGGVHHDTKPLPGKPEDRKRRDRMSGGGLLSISDAPVHVERIDERRTLVVPSGFKFSEDPSPFLYSFDHDGDDGAMTWIRLRGQDTTETKAKDLAIREKIKDYLRHNPDSSTRAVSSGVRGNKDAARSALDALVRDGELDSRKGPRGAILWFLIDKGEADQ